ncbi:MAG TPA: folylpolyglutamate synthase/dihydrofolate synthase family protein, partial [Chitinophagaceae bacterium]|nr:folylpolyglutamate synthase/dihydrofolate synthase family protein [Chitinophagaceae bacterium]
ANTIRICQSLGQPQTKFKSVHIAGTNGKGSVSHMLAAIFHAAGYKTGLYTSPHLKDFRERIKVSSNGEGLQEISRQFIVDFTEKIKPLIEEIEPSFFEITVGMAFDYFKECGVEIAIIETGLGGRLDSTNVVVPELAIITNIGMDHMNILGDSLEKIAGEKAGIIKEKVPVVIGEVLPQTISVFEAKAKEKNAPLYIASKKRQAVDWKWLNHELIVEVAEEHVTDHKIFHLDLPGIYQLKNLLTVLESCYRLKSRGWNLPDEVIHKALRHVKKITGLHGRWDIIHQHPTVVLDVAHNEDGIHQLLEQIEVTDHHRLHLITGFVKDKEVDRILSMLPKTAEYYFTQANIPRALETATLLQKAKGYGLKGRKYPDVNSALKNAIATAGKDDLIVVCGSVFLVGEVQMN